MDLSNLNPQQKKAVEAPHEPLLIVAGAGTGKTRTLTSRLLAFIAHGVPPGNICAVTFTNKAAREMADRVYKFRSLEGEKLRRSPNVQTSQLTNFQTHAPYIGTFHALGAKILRAEARVLRRTPDFVIFDAHDALSAVKKVLKELDMKSTKPARLLQLISFVKSGASRGEQFHSKSEEAALERYELFLARNNAFDFDDLIQKPVYIFEQRPAILAKYQERYTHILVDEYQDVSPGQYRLIRFLAGHRNQVSVVGDDAQMIYGWRYANIDTFLGFERDWPRARVVFLEENYRSSGTIVQAASAVIAHNEVAREKNLWTRNNDGEPITILEAGDEDEEAEWIAEEVEKVKRLKGEKENATFSPSHLLTSPTIAILYRTNAQSRALEQALIRRNIPYRIYGGLKFYERREIKDIVAALRLALNPRDELSRERLEKAFRLRTFREILPVLHASSAQAPAAAIQSFLAAASYFEYLERETMNPEERRENIEELVSFAEGFTDIPSFLEHVALVQSTDDVNASRQSQSANRNPGSDANSSRLAISDLQAPPVHLSTIHLAKGLEFDYVFLAGCAEGLLPHARSVESEEELEEERRLMYVAMTRARKELAISFYGIPSRFIGEIPPEFAEFLRLENDSGATENEPEVQLLE